MASCPLFWRCTWRRRVSPTKRLDCCLPSHWRGCGYYPLADHLGRPVWPEAHLVDWGPVDDWRRPGIYLHQKPCAADARRHYWVISPSGNEIGPFLAVEQAGLTQLIPDKRRTQVFAWYNLAGSFATATGALSGGWLAEFLQKSGVSAFESYRSVLMGYAAGWRSIVHFIPVPLFYNRGPGGIS